MANIHSQKKRIERAERERLENRRYTSRIKTYFRRLETAVAGGDEPPPRPSTATLVQTIDKAVKRGALHRNTGARKKSRAARVRRGSRRLSSRAPSRRSPLQAAIRLDRQQRRGVLAGAAAAAARARRARGRRSRSIAARRRSRARPAGRRRSAGRRRATASAGPA